jgi:predicted Zn-dependent protease
MTDEQKNSFGFLSDDKIIENKQSIKNIRIYISKEIEYFDTVSDLLTKSISELNKQIRNISNDKNVPFANIKLITLEKNKEHLPEEYKVILFDGTIRNPCNNNFALACLNTDTLFKKHKIFLSTALLDQNKILYQSTQYGTINFNRLFNLNDTEKEVAKQEVLIHELGHMFGLKDHYLYKEQDEGVYKFKNTQSSYYSHFYFIKDLSQLISTKPGLKEFDLRELKRKYVD